MVGLIISGSNELSVITRRYPTTKSVSGTNKNFFNFSIGNTEITAVESGVGIKNARTAANDLINRFKPEIIVNAGVAGALSPGIEVGNVVVGEWVYSLKKNLRINLLYPAESVPENAIAGGILTNNKFVDNHQAKKCLYEKTGAMVVDMETWGVAEVCQGASLGLVAVKSVSDMSTDDLPLFGRILNQNGRLRYRIAAGYFASNPYMLYKYLQFRYINMRKAVINLNNFIIRFVNNNNYE